MRRALIVLLGLLALLAAGRWLAAEREARRLRAERPLPVARAPGLPSEPWGYEVPVRNDAPWPLFRRDRRNTGRTPIPARWHGDRPWAFATGKGIFSTPVIDGDGTLYVGSADHVFYAIAPDGTERWRYETGEIIDSAAALPRREEGSGRAAVLVPSGDGHLYKLWTEPGLGRDERRAWAFDARGAPGRHFNDWFEASVAVGYDGTLYAGNTNFHYYAITPDGRRAWTYATGANAWSMAGLADDGTLFWGSLDARVRAVRPDGSEKWSRRTLGFIAASAAVGSDGTLYIGSFDSHLYALDPATGRVRWKFRTGDHVYASAALGEDASGRTRAVYFGSADGTFYAVSPEGELLWRHDTGDPIRSSAALGAAPPGDAHAGILYFGSSDGRLYALHADDGTLRWSFDTTAADPERADRNDLNGSVALGATGAYLGGEAGSLWYVPYDYCLHAGDPRCRAASGEDRPADAAGLRYVTPGGTTRDEGPGSLAPGAILTLRLRVRRRGATVDARLCNTPVWCWGDALRATADPPFDFALEKSPDGRYLHVLPTGLLEPDTDYRLRVAGSFYTGGLRLGNLNIGGTRDGEFDETLRFHTAPLASAAPVLSVGTERVSAFEWTRPALPIPPMLPSLNQIGFDYLDWIVGAVDVGEPDARGSAPVLLWAMGARRDAEGRLVADPASDFLLPLAGTLRGDAFLLRSAGFPLRVTGIPIPLRRLEMRGQFGDDLAVRPGASLYAETDVLSIPTFGPLLVMAGLANDLWRELVVSGTYVTRPYAGPANRRPPGLAVASLAYTSPTAVDEGRVTARFARAPGRRVPGAIHRPAILLLDAELGEPVPLAYADAVTAQVDAEGNLSGAALAIPAGTKLPERLEAVVLLDVFPLHRAALGEG